jgi:hypothetical protein
MRDDGADSDEERMQTRRAMPRQTVTRAVGFRLLAVAVGVIVAVAATEIMLRVFEIGYGNAPMVSDPILDHVHPKNYTFRSHTPSGEYGGHLVHYDADGCVAPTQPAGRASDAKYRVAFLGDSFVEAGQVPYADSFVGILDAASRGLSLVRNYGVSSYSPMLYLLQWRVLVWFFRPTHVFVLLFSNDVGDDQGYAQNAVRSENGEVVAVPGPSDAPLVLWLRSLYVARLIRKAQLKIAWLLANRNAPPPKVVGDSVEEDPDISPLTAALVQQLAEAVTASGARFVLMAVPSKYRLTGGHADPAAPEFADKWKDWAADHGVEYVDLVVPFREAVARGSSTFFAMDMHFNRTGHAVVASVLRARYPEIFGNDRITPAP